MPRPHLSVTCPTCGTDGRPITTRIPFCSSRCRILGARLGIILPEDSARFDAKLVRDGACLIFQGDLNHAGYGTFYLGRYGMRAHQFVWIRQHGPIPDDLDVCHNCPGGDRPACVEVEHLWLGTHQENMDDMVAKGRSAKGDRSAQHMRPEIRARGERSGMAKLTEDQIRTIRATYRPGKPGNGGGGGTPALARVYGVSAQTIDAILKRKTWTHVV